MRPFDPLGVPLEGLNLVEAGAGTGKTYNITLLVARLVAEVGLPIEEILVVTFTEAATAELREAIRERLLRVRAALDPSTRIGAARIDESDRALAGKLAGARETALARIRAALGDFDRAAVFTIHGFGRRALVEHAFDSGAPLDLELEVDRAAASREIACDTWAEMLWEADGLLAEALIDSWKGPAGLAKLIGFAGEQPDLRLVGGDPVDPASRPDPLLALAAAAAKWRSARPEIAIVLQEALREKALNARSYTAPKIDAWAAELDAFFARARPGRSIPEGLERFSASALAERTNKAARLAGRTPAHPFFDAADALVAVLGDLARFLDAEVAHARRRVFARARERIDDDKRRRRVQSFADLLLDLDRALADEARGPRLAARLGHRYRAALIDEFQDTDRIQWRIFQRVFHREDTSLFIIGDPKQSIYAFRGGDVFTYLAAAASAGKRCYTLDTNWRSDPSVLEGVGSLLSGVPAPFVDERIAYRPAIPRPGAADRLRIAGAAASGVEILFLGRDPADPKSVKAITKGLANETIPKLVADDLARLLASASLVDASGDGERPLTPSDVAILVPKNEQAEWLRRALRRRGIPGVLWNQGSVFDSEEAGWFADLLAVLADPADTAAMRRVLAADLFGLDGARLAAFEQDEGAFAKWASRFAGWRETWRRRGFVHAIGEVFDCDAAHGIPALARLMTLEGGERRVTNLRHLADLAHAAALRDRLAVAGLVRWFDLRRSLDDDGGRDGDALELESDAQAVRLITIHKSKGLEFPVVYLPFSFDDGSPPGGKQPFVFHDPGDLDRACLELGSADLDRHLALAAEEHRAERARMLYVALTRARHQCRLVWGAINGAGRSSLGRLLHPEGSSPVAGQIEKAGDDDLLADLGALESRSGGAVSVSVLDDRNARFDAPRAADPSVLAPRGLARPLPEARRMSSYSTLLRGDHHTHREEASAAAAAAPASRSQATVEDFERIPLADLPAGKRMGTCLHEVLERVDFAAADPEAISRIAADRLDAHGLGASSWSGPVGEALAGALGTRLDGTDDGPTLAAVEPDAMAVEMDFLIPAAGDRPVTGQQLAAALSAGGSSDLPESYLVRMRDLARIPPGWLRGIVDLVFEWRGRFWIADYKSNHLGPRWSDYAPPALERAMEQHHYHLQCHIYTLAVDRLLRSRVAGYSYERHFGGALWLFLRGMRPLAGEAPGVFAARPPAAAIRALDLLVSGAKKEDWR